MKTTDNEQNSRAQQPTEPIPEEPTPEFVQVEPVPVNRPLPRAVRIEITPEPIVDEPEIISLTGCSENSSRFNRMIFFFNFPSKSFF